MCGKYILAQAAKAERALGIRRGRWEYPPSYRVLPTEQVPVAVTAEGEREAAMMRWGLIPCWAQGVPLKASTINATVERIASAPSYRDPWRRGQRCIFVMGGFYEPHVNADGSREPFFLALIEREVFGVAGLWERSRRADGSYVFLLHADHGAGQPAARGGSQREAAHAGASSPRTTHEAWLGGGTDEAQAAAQALSGRAHGRPGRSAAASNSPRLPNDASLIEPLVVECECCVGSSRPVQRPGCVMAVGGLA